MYKSYSLNYYVKVLISYTFIYYIFLQLNFSLLSHNFGIRQGDIIDFRISYIVTILLVAYVILKKFLKSTTVHLSNMRDLVKSYHYIAPLIIYIIFYISSAELWSDLIWRLFSIDLYNSSSLLNTFLLSLTLILIFRYLKVSFTNIILLFLFIHTNNILIPLTLYYLGIN